MKTSITKILALVSLSVAILLSYTVTIEGKEPKRPPGSKRSTALDFDGDLVEGVNKKPYDSLSELYEKRRNRRAEYLYRKKKRFESDNLSDLQKFRYIQ